MLADVAPVADERPFRPVGSAITGTKEKAHGFSRVEDVKPS
ncbi:hypothetical protein HSR121_2860 [Halapricum desulfuricans]|uniref:Uncharacterized protein n=1 Tax=Halapricum desulfuricans TaxID=2841257 RepID=A0A897N4M1_9EURY|nr:hypothetical protein HSR121_2860 [Halapricum desulfuricans]